MYEQKECGVQLFSQAQLSVHCVGACVGSFKNSMKIGQTATMIHMATHTTEYYVTC